ncbi:uncharacterized protein LOC131167063 isoform X2 [Malania oleifera]|uniref:uncharacterized protein LOC131167063 isoform X2 n=1 Tax=Malania oleifera TaxID=397392 RepID=UPI0025AE02FB|nr:uncharacterized protein LOC131167063 isoform X2 [Malania oleifera]
MPVSGNEELRVKPVAWHSSDSNAGVPIKKRRFPLIHPPSPPSDAQSPPQGENKLLQKEQSKSFQESSLSNACVATDSSGLTDTHKNSFVEGKKEGSADTKVSSAQSDANSSRIKLQEPSLTFFSGSLDVADSKKTLVPAEKSACQITAGNMELKLAPIEALALNVGKELCCKPKVEVDSRSESSITSGNTELYLGLKEPLVLALAGRQSGDRSQMGQHSEKSSQMSESIDPFSLNLSLSKGKAFSQFKNKEIELNKNRDCRHANRSNWDLNTTMDTWGGSESDAAAGVKNVGLEGLKATDGPHDAKPSVHGAGMMIGGDCSGVLGKQVFEESEYRSNISNPIPNRQQCETEQSIHLHLSPSYLQTDFNNEESGLRRSPAKINSGSVFPKGGLPGTMVSSLSTGNLNALGCRSVKSEPFDDSVNENSNAQVYLKGNIDRSTVKIGATEKCSVEALKLSNISAPNLNVNDCRSIKSEPVHEGNQEIFKTAEGTPHKSVGQVLKCADAPVAPVSIALQMSSSGFLTCSPDLPKNENPLSHVEISTHTKGPNFSGEEACASVEPTTSGMVSASVGHDDKESNISDGIMDDTGSNGLNVDNSQKLWDELPVGSLDEGSVSDEEKIDISADMLEDDSYGSDYDSDGNHVLPYAEDRLYGGEDDDYEDGEVREPLVHTAIEGSICENGEVENVNHGDCDNRNTDFQHSPCEVHLDSSQIEGKDDKVVETCEANIDLSKECFGTFMDEKTDQSNDKKAHLQESCGGEMQTIGTEKGRSVKAVGKKLLDQLGRKDEIKCHEVEQLSDRVTMGDQGTAADQSVDENIKRSNSVDKKDSSLLDTEASLKSDGTAKDSSSGGKQSRIINLFRPSNVSSSYKTRTIPARSLPSRTGRERFTEFVLEGDKLHSRGSRDELYIDSPRKFLRERNQDQSLRNSRLNMGRGRGRGSNRLDALRGDWDTDRTGRGGRKPLNDEVSVFHHPSSRRRSPGGSEVQAARGVQMVRRLRRSISPSKCIGEDGSDIIGLRHNEKFTRGLPGDIVDPMFARSRPPYEEVNDHFLRRSREFSSVHRRGFHHIRSRSPIRPRTRSPGPWSSPRRRSPDVFNRHPELTHRRSPAIYRMERMRSPDRPCFPGDLLARRRGSPPYLPRQSNDLREIDSARDHGHPRSMAFNRRSPSGRVLPRSTRRFDIIDPRERTDNDEYFGEPVHAGRFHELSGDANGDERRKYGERRGPLRSFRPPYTGAESGNFRFHLEDGPRPFRFCPEADSDFQERSNLREREFDRRNKNRLGNAPRGTRSIEEEEGNYRHGGQVWHDDVFDDVSRMKRRRF